MAMNKSARLYGVKDLRLEEGPISEPGKNEVLVQMAFVGMCGTDVHFYDEGAIDHYILTSPLTLGHEMSGVISKLGPGVTTLQVGDRVVIDPNRPCHKCRTCRRGKLNICEKFDVAGIPPTDGGFARYMLAPASTCHKLPDHVSLQAAACMEPMVIGLHSLHRAQLTPGDIVVIIGAGSVGLLTMQAAKALGAAKVMIVDVNPLRLELATKMGADVIFKTEQFTDTKAAGEAIKKALGEEADLVVECSGAKGAVDTAIHTCRPGGKIAMVGFGEMAMHVHLGMAAAREIDIIGCVCNNNDFPECVELVSAGKVDATPIITHVLPLDKIMEALNLVREADKSIKVMIDCQK